MPHPLLPGPGGLKSPYSVGLDEPVDDPGAWQLWWDFNKDPYLRYTAISTGARATIGDDFFLGAGERAREVGGRADREVLDGKIGPALIEAIKKGPTFQYSESVMLAMAKVGGEEHRRHFDFVLNWFLNGENADPQMNHVAPVAIGLLRNPGSYEVLSGLARNDENGQRTYGGPVEESMRAFAAYGLGLVGHFSPDLELRRDVVADLVTLLEDEDAASNDLRVAAMVAMSLVPLDVVEDAVVCYCGTCEVADPHASLQAQVTYLLRYFTADRDFDPVVRAHTATTLGRLIEARPKGMTLRLKEVVAEFLIEALQKNRRQPVEVKQSVVLALGLVGDADEDSIDQWIRWALNRSAGRGGPIEKRFAMISLAQVGSRGGTGEDAWSGTAECRKDLLHHMMRGKKDVKPWAGLALGVLGSRLAASGVERDASVDVALRRAIKSSKKVDDLGAFALAAGLRRSQEAIPQLLDKLDDVRDETARSYVALALGLLGAREAVEPLQEALANASAEPQLASRAGLALGLLGDTDVVPMLLAMLEEREDAPIRAAVSRAMGYIGDVRSIETLATIGLDEEAENEVREAAVLALGLAAEHSLPWRALFANGTNYLAQSAVLSSPEKTGVLDFD